jgi:glycosyltransferase involved in cell wall biosynthesis
MVQNKLRVALVCDWLTTMGGAEPVVLELHKLFPDAPIFTSVYDQAHMPAFKDCDVRTTYLQKLLPRSLRYKHVLWPVFRAFAFRGLDVKSYDLIISSSGAEAKVVRKKPGTIHISYCHTPTRYYWSHYQEFKKEFNFGALTPFIRPFIPLFVRWMRRLDLKSIQDVDHFIANSETTKARIKKYYHRDSIVIHPPVDTKRFFSSVHEPRDGCIVWGRHVPYKRFDLAIQACNELGLKLTVVGRGPDTQRLKKIAGPTISFPGHLSHEALAILAHKAKYFLFPNEEDFGIAAVEAMAAGLPVIAYRKGGALDIIEDGQTGVLFAEQTVESMVQAIRKAQTLDFSGNLLRQRSKRFDRTLFSAKMKKIIGDYLADERNA